METNKLIAGIVAAAIAIIVLAGVLMPALSNATDTHDTFYNTGYYRMAEKTITGAETLSIEWDYSNPRDIVVDGVTFTIDEAAIPASTTRTVAFCDNYLLRLAHYSPDSWGMELWYTAAQSVNTSDAVALEVDLSADTFTWTKGTADPMEFSYSGKWIVVDAAGEWMMKSATETAYINSDSVVKGAGISRTGTGDNHTTMSFFITGTVDDLTVTNPNSITITNVESHYTAADNYLDLYKLDSITFTTTYNAMVVDQTYNFFCVPYEVTAEKAVHLDPAMNGILAVIPLLIIVAVLLGVVAIFILRRE